MRQRRKRAAAGTAGVYRRRGEYAGLRWEFHRHERMEKKVAVQMNGLVTCPAPPDGVERSGKRSTGPQTKTQSIKVTTSSAPPSSCAGVDRLLQLQWRQRSPRLFAAYARVMKSGQRGAVSSDGPRKRQR